MLTVVRKNKTILIDKIINIVIIKTEKQNKEYDKVKRYFYREKLKETMKDLFKKTQTKIKKTITQFKV